MFTTQSPRVVAYVRLSQEREESTSIRRQWQAIEAHAAAKGWTISEADRFEDVDVSGYKEGTKRPGRDAFVAAMKNADVALFYRVDRVARSLLDFAAIMRVAEQSDVALVSATESIDTSTPMGRAMLQIVAIFAELESRTISARVTSSVDYLRRNGRRAGGQVPWGWANVANPDGPGHVLALDPERAPLVREAVARVLSGDSLRAIAADWTARGIPTPQGGSSWGGDTLGALLRRPVLAGLTTHRGEILHGDDGLPVTDASAALLTRSEWSALLAELDRRANPAERKARGLALLHGVLSCSSCSSRLYIHRPKDPKRASSYVCQNRECAAPVAVSAARIEEYVSTEVRREWGHLVIREGITARDDAPSLDLAVVETAIADTLARMGHDDADVSALAESLADLKARRTALRSAAPVEFSTWRETGQTLTDALDRAADDDERREILAAVLPEVVVSKGERGRHGLDLSRVSPRWTDTPPMWKTRAGVVLLAAPAEARRTA